MKRSQTRLRNEFKQRPIMTATFDEILKIGPSFSVSESNRKGGYYEFKDNLIRFYGSSRDYGAVPQEVLREFESPAREYCAKNGFELQKLLID
ncbi:MAG: hypothetical protein AABX11_06685 [Nanoarchaeota archaeon]